MAITKPYTIYVEHLGKMDAELTSEILIYPLSGDYSDAYITIKSGVGTIPENQVALNSSTGSLKT